MEIEQYPRLERRHADRLQVLSELGVESQHHFKAPHVPIAVHDAGCRRSQACCLKERTRRAWVVPFASSVSIPYSSPRTHRTIPATTKRCLGVDTGTRSEQVCPTRIGRSPDRR